MNTKGVSRASGAHLAWQLPAVPHWPGHPSHGRHLLAARGMGTKPPWLSCGPGGCRGGCSPCTPCGHQLMGEVSTTHGTAPDILFDGLRPLRAHVDTVMMSTSVFLPLLSRCSCDNVPSVEGTETLTVPLA